MKKILKFFTFAIALIGVVCLASCSFDSVTSLSFNGLIKQEFEKNDALDVSIKVTVDNVDETVRVQISNTGTIISGNDKYKFTVDGFDTTTVGSKTYTITLDGSTLSCYYVVTDTSALVITGDGTEGNPFVIYNTANFLAIQGKVDDAAVSSTTYFKLANNLNFYGVTYAPINTGAGKKVVINGNNKTISNIEYDGGENADTVGIGVFGLVQGELDISGLKLDSLTFKGKANVGILVGKNHGDTATPAPVVLDNVSISNSSVTGYKWIGGFVASAYGNVTVNNCSVSDTILLAKATSSEATNIADAKKVGTVVGMLQGYAVTINNYKCEDVEIYGSRDLGLLVGISTVASVKLAGNLVIAGVNKVIATVTEGHALISGNSPAVMQATAGALIGTWHENATVLPSAADQKYGMKDFSKFVLNADFKIFAGENEVLFDAVNGYFAAGNRIENVLSVRSSDAKYGSLYNTETFIRFIGGVRVDSTYYTPFVK